MRITAEIGRSHAPVPWDDYILARITLFDSKGYAIEQVWNHDNFISDFDRLWEMMGQRIKEGMIENEN